MKKMMILAMMMTIAISAAAMSYSQARNEALFLSDKMAYELDLTNAQYDAVYEINLDYLMALNGHADVFGYWWNRRNQDLRYVLTAWQYDTFMGRTYFYRPVSWFNGSWLFNVYAHYVNRNKFYKPRPSVFISYKGGNNRKHDRYYEERNIHPTTRGKGSTPRMEKNDRQKPSREMASSNKNVQTPNRENINTSSKGNSAISRPGNNNRKRVASSVPAKRGSSATTTRSSNRSTAQNSVSGGSRSRASR